MERATFKIEIPFTDHAHCIGRQGNQIQSIMSATDTHIHFPDGNREPNGTKSNQVSITGTIISIEQARKRLKDILPMSLKFLLPSKQFSDIMNDDYPLFKNVQTRFGVLVLSRSYAKTGDVYCIVRGLINQPELAEATEYLIQTFYAFEAALIKVTCQIQVSEQYHVYLQTRQQSKDMCIASIEQYTNTIIQFPTIITNGYGRRTSVIITGSPTQVCQARKLFDLCLPIILTFEIPISKEPSRAEIARIKDKLNVTMIIRTRKDKIGKLISIQTQEYNSEQLFHARSIILDLPEINNHNLFDLNSTSTYLSDLSTPATFLASSSASPILTNHMTDSILIPIEPCYLPSTQQIDTLLVPVDGMMTTKKPSPIGHERSSLLRNLEQDTLNASTSSTKIFTLLCSMNLEKYWSTFEHNEIMSWPLSVDVNDYDNFSNNPLSYFIDDVNNNISHFPSLSLLST